MTETEWIATGDKIPPTDEPVVYCMPRGGKKWSVGIAYWTVSEKWMPEMNSEQAPEGFTHWIPLPDPPKK